jgi:PadR family transcriptional regulator, regulatory protein PadR
MKDRRGAKADLLPGTLEMLILKTLSIESMHGYGIAQHIQTVSAEVLRVEEGSLYPALQRLLLKGWVTAEWKQSANNRRARFYELTTTGRRQLGVEEAGFEAIFAAILKVLRTT